MAAVLQLQHPVHVVQYVFCNPDMLFLVFFFFFSSRRRHTRFDTGVQTCALPIWRGRCVGDVSFHPRRQRTARASASATPVISESVARPDQPARAASATSPGRRSARTRETSSSDRKSVV